MRPRAAFCLVQTKDEINNERPVLWGKQANQTVSKGRPYCLASMLIRRNPTRYHFTITIAFIGDRAALGAGDAFCKGDLF